MAAANPAAISVSDQVMNRYPLLLVFALILGLLACTAVLEGQNLYPHHTPYGLASQFADHTEVDPEGSLVVDSVPLYIWYADTLPAIWIYGFVEHPGFVMVTGSLFPPAVLAWSVRSQLDTDDLPPAMDWWVSEYIAGMEPIPQRDSVTFLGNESAQNVGNPELFSLQGVSPLLHTRWDQRCFYNDSCPADPVAPAYYCARVPAGCVATTLAQIMKFHKWPWQGNGHNSYHSVRYGPLSANFGNTIYPMAMMPNELFSPDPEVAQLLWHAGVATHMQYGPYASGTGITETRNALVNYFRYHPSAQIIAKSNYQPAQWHQLLRDEIDQGRPIFYSGVDLATNTGHAWVLDGYADSNYFHFNWGWSGIADGYYMLSSMNPLGTASYTAYQEAIVGITPDGDVPVAAFTANHTSVEVGQPVTFSAITAGNITEWNWFFQGGVPAMYVGEHPPAITWDQGGIYDVMLVVSNGLTTDTMLRKRYIKVLPLAAYTASKTRIQAGSTIHFYDASISAQPVQQYRWHFKGGVPSTSIEKNPQNIHYPHAGQFPVIMEITAGGHTDRRVFSRAITVYQQCDTLMHYDMPGYSVQAANQATFEIIKLDLDSLVPYHAPAISSGWDYFSEGGGANHFISATSLFQTPGTANNWLILGPVTIPAEGATLQWRHKMPDHTKRDGYQVFFNNDSASYLAFGEEPEFVVGDNDPFTLGDTAWRWNEIPIKAQPFGNENLYIGIHHNAHNMFYIALDDLMIFRCDTFPHLANLFSFDTLVTAGDTVRFYDLSSGSPDWLQWTFPGGIAINNNTDNPKVVYAAPGVYDVSLTAWYGNVSHQVTKTEYIRVLPVSVEELINQKGGLSVSPNPFTSSVTLSGMEAPFRYVLMDLTGREVMQGFIESGEATLHLESLPAGVWMISVESPEGQRGVQKLIKR